MLPRNIKFHIFLWIIIIISFVFLATFLIFKASGYTINLKAKIIEKSALIVVGSSPDKVDVYLNDELQGQTPLEIPYLHAGLYRIKITKDNYHFWEKTFNIEAGKYETIDAVLFLSNPQIQPSDENEYKDKVETKEVQLADEIMQKIPKGAQDVTISASQDIILYKIGLEIWQYENEKDGSAAIVARFMQDIKNLKFYPDNKHILFMMDTDLYVMDVDGTNCIKLFTLSSEDFWPSRDGNEIYFQKDGLYEKATIH